MNEIVPVEESVFQTPKPPRLLHKILSLGTSGDDIVVDSFAGSGTTGQAVLELNKLDGGSRRFILVQQPFDTKNHKSQGFNICEKLTSERVRRVIKGYPFEGTKRETLLEEQITMGGLRKADELLDRIGEIKRRHAGLFDEVKAECKSGVLRVIGVKTIRDKTAGLGGSFTYARVSNQPLLGEYRDLGDRLPSYDEMAKYVFYTETSKQWSQSEANKKTGKIGEHAKTSYYLLYRPNRRVDWPIDMEFLETTAARDPNRRLVVYCEKIWLHRNDLRAWEAKTGKKVRTMVVPWNLK